MKNNHFGCLGWVVIVIVGGVALTGCNVTRRITTESAFLQRGDTAVVIQSKTVETYDASRK